jgi:hypothetical protein
MTFISAAAVAKPPVMNAGMNPGNESIGRPMEAGKPTGAPEPPKAEPGMGKPVNAYGGVAGANPVAGYRRFDVDGGEGSMRHHFDGMRAKE